MHLRRGTADGPRTVAGWDRDAMSVYADLLDGIGAREQFVEEDLGI